MSLGRVSRVCEGGTIACLASGPSLTLADVNYVRDRVDRVIAVNDAIQLAPWADVLCCIDQIWWGRHYKAMRSFRGLKVRTHHSQHKVVPTRLPNDRYCHGCDRRLLKPNECWCEGIVTLLNAGPTGLSLDQGALCTYDNSGGAAINLAVLLGAKRVILLGYDMGPHNGRRHFFDTAPTSINSPFDKFRKRMATMVEPLRVAGVEVVNCSRRTALECFPCLPLEEALPVGEAVAC